MNDIKILSWNICFECMTNKNLGSAGWLGHICKPVSLGSNITICAQNIINCINNSQHYDIIGFQEASRWYEIIPKTYLKDYSYVHSTINKEEMITIYNPKRFILEAYKINNDIYNGRPYQILFLKDINTQENIICINIHNEHSNNKDKIIDQLCNDINKIFIVNHTPSIKYEIKNAHTITSLSDISTYLKEKTLFNIILFGDLNDSLTLNLWNGFIPFAKSKINQLNQIHVNSASVMPPLTCCFNGINSLKHTSPCDYILISNNMKYTQNNTILDEYTKNMYPANFHELNTKGTSDHAPIYAIINYKQKQPSSQVIQSQVIQPVIPQKYNYDELKRCKFKKINIINYLHKYINKLNKLKKEDFTPFKYKISIKNTGNLINDIKQMLLYNDGMIINEIKQITSLQNNIYITFKNFNPLLIKDTNDPNIFKIDLSIDNKGIAILFKDDNNIVIKENIYLLFFLLNIDFNIMYNNKLLIDAFIDEFIDK